MPGTASPGALHAAVGFGETSLMMTLENLTPGFAPAGDSWLQTVTLLADGGASFDRPNQISGCLNATDLLIDASNIYVSCTGPFDPITFQAQSGKVAQFALQTRTLKSLVDTAGGPGASASAEPSRYWFTNVSGHGAMNVVAGRNTLTVERDAAHELTLCPGDGYPSTFGSSVASPGALFGTCSNFGAGGESLFAATPFTDGGADFVRTTLTTGPVALDTYGDLDTQIATVTAGANTVEFFTFAQGAFTKAPETIVLPSGSGPNDIAVAPNNTAFVALSFADRVMRLDIPGGTGAAGIRDSFQFPAGSNPTSLFAESDKVVWVTLYGTGQLARVAFP